MSINSVNTVGAPPLTVQTSAQAGLHRPLRLLCVEQNLDGTTGGSYRSLLYLLKGLNKQDYAPVVAFYRTHELMEDYRAAGCRTMLLVHPKPFDLQTPLRSLGPLGRLLVPGAAWLQKALNAVWVTAFLFVRGLLLLVRERVQVLHLNNGVSAGHELLMASALLGIPCIIHQRGIMPISTQDVRLSRRAAHIICVSEAARQHLIDHGLRADRCTAIHNGINMAELKGKIKRTPAEVRCSLGIADGRVIVGLAGMIRPWKGQMVLVQAIERLKTKHPQILGLIMGGVSDTEPADRAYLEQILAYIASHDLVGHIVLLDYQPNAPEFLQAFDVMVHTAVDPEPFSRVVIEGMALERPIVASATGGTPEAIDDGESGFLVPPEDAEALAEGISRLVEAPALRAAVGTAARLKVERRFLIEGHVARTTDVYQSILRRQS